jgi:hypothetical protein
VGEVFDDDLYVLVYDSSSIIIFDEFNDVEGFETMS